MKKTLLLIVTIFASSAAFSQTYLNFTPNLAGEYKIDGRPVYCTISEAPALEEKEAVKQEGEMQEAPPEGVEEEGGVERLQFMLKYDQKRAEGREVRSSSEHYTETLGEWYRVGRTFGRFVLSEIGVLQYQQGADRDYDKIIEVTRTYNFPDKVLLKDVDVYEGKMNTELVEESKAKKQADKNCFDAEQELKNKYMYGQGTLRFAFEDQVLYIVSDKPGEHANYEGIMTKTVEGSEAEKLTHKVKFTWRENNEEYMPIVEKLECGVPSGVEQPHFEIDRMKKYVVLGGRKFLRARGM